MYLKSLEITGFKSFGKKEHLDFNAPISGIVGPNGSGKSNVAEAFRFVLGEQSIKSLRGKKGEDLIFNGGKSASRANRASVRVVFDNTRRLFNIDFNDVTIERTVHRDGVNQYFINGTQVRLRDVAELLAEANIGSSGHHIISQGEADRLLSASSKERREMIEDALGLRLYHYKLSESEKKLTKTRENIAQVEALRKEIGPHLRFLKKQVEKIEKTKDLRDELGRLYQDYLKREEVYLQTTETKIKKAKEEPSHELARLEEDLAKAKAILEREHAGDAHSREVVELEGQLRKAREESEGVLREQAKLEGQLAFEERRLESERRRLERMDERSIPLKEVRLLVKDMEERQARALAAEDLSLLKQVLFDVVALVRDFVHGKEQMAADEHAEVTEIETTVRSIAERLQELTHKATVASEKERTLLAQYESLRKAADAARDESREAERQMFAIMTRENELRGLLQTLAADERALLHRKEAFEAELREGSVLVGRLILTFSNYNPVDEQGGVLSLEALASETPERQEERRRHIERMKIRLEELGSGSGDDVLKEFNETQERDQFLEREIVDLEKSAQSLNELITELEVKLDLQFKEGITKINKEFQTFFALMFGGGTAALSVIREVRRKRSEGEDLLETGEGDDVPEEGIDIAISLPHKRIKGLVMLSGGERALTSIALLFAMSQVNPPPFLILDETDAALDEANSRRYADMIENLAKYSQLILITHNRETMSRAQILYGITMGGEGISKILSVRFEEAVQVAK